MTALNAVRFPAHTDYTVTVVRPTGERLEHYTPFVYNTRAAAQRECDRINNGKRTRYGVAEVTETKRPASTGYTMRLRLP